LNEVLLRIYTNIKYSEYASFPPNIKSQIISELLKKQNYRCAICDETLFNDPNRGKIPFQDQPVVDHDHNTDEIRGVVHSQCNVDISTLERHSPEWIIKARDYLESKNSAKGKQVLEVTFVPSPRNTKFSLLDLDQLKIALQMTNSIVLLNNLKDEFYRFDPPTQQELLKLYDENHKEWEKPDGTIRLAFGNLSLYFKDFIPYIIPEYSGRIEPDFWRTSGILDAVSWIRHIPGVNDILIDKRIERLTGIPSYDLK
jgi:hypothetical protein